LYFVTRRNVHKQDRQSDWPQLLAFVWLPRRSYPQIPHRLGRLLPTGTGVVFPHIAPHTGPWETYYQKLIKKPITNDGSSQNLKSGLTVPPLPPVLFPSLFLTTSSHTKHRVHSHPISHQLPPLYIPPNRQLTKCFVHADHTLLACCCSLFGSSTKTVPLWRSIMSVHKVALFASEASKLLFFARPVPVHNSLSGT
jgi:hypothetical protein